MNMAYIHVLYFLCFFDCTVNSCIFYKMSGIFSIFTDRFDYRSTLLMCITVML